MKINKVKKVNRKLLAVIIAVVVLTLALAAYIFVFRGSIFGWSIENKPTSISKIDYNAPTEDQVKAGNAIKEQTVSDSSKPDSSNSDTAASPQPQAGGKSLASLILTSKNQTSATLQLRVSIGALTNSGTCTLTMTKDGQTVTKTAGVQAIAQESTCKGFDVPVAELSKGVWTIVVHFENDNVTGDVKDTVTVN